MTAGSDAAPRVARSLLFVPGSAPERFAKALATQADIVCLDLEDAVAPDAKERARSAVLDFIARSPERARLCVRLNRLGSAFGFEDAAAFARAAALPGFLMLPKAECARDTDLLAAAFPSHAAPPLIALVENAAGVEAAFEIARSPAVVMLMFGSFDYAAETGCNQEWGTLVSVRSRLVAAAASAGKTALDSPFAGLDDLSAAALEARMARGFGFCGKATIHPKFVAGINEAFAPTAAELAEARAILEAFESAGDGVARIGGKLVELPVVLRMRRLLDRAARS